MTVSVATLAGYQIWLRAGVRRDPGRSVHALNRHARTAWVEAMMADPANGVLAVQTLHNSVVASTLMASTSVLLIIVLFCIPLVFWLFGPPFIVAASVGLVFALHRLDRSPPPMAADAPS